ncbi:MAG: pilus assembly protein TadG-related protein [Croceibacterium sp.]
MHLRLASIRPALRGFFARLARDVAGNTIMIVAASLIPLLAMVGGGVDVSRGYLAQSRLQQACDAGVLAARKRLGSDLSSGSLTDQATQAGNSLFDINFEDGIYGTKQRSFAMQLNPDTSVGGVANVVVPTTVMSVFGYHQIPLHVSCEARLNMSNTDVMMVLDVTGSMAQTNPGDSVSKIEALKSTVKAFYIELSAAAQPATRIRYGFVPYSTNVNVGALLDKKWIANQWSYNMRAVKSSDDTKLWKYDTMPVSTAFATTATPTKNFKIGGTPSSPTNVSVTWKGCIEERQTYNIDDYTNVDLSKALDLDIDLVPDSGKPETQWKPALHELSYERQMGAGANKFDSAPITTAYNYMNAYSYGMSVCPPAARKLATITGTQLDAYLATLKAQGNTYHDIGILWGGRLLSPTGIFASENGDVNGIPTNRNLIMLTDGQTEPLDIVYGSYGIEPLDKRRWQPGGKYTLTQTVEKRFSFVCDEIKKRNITIWFVAFGTTLNPIMTQCAGPGHFFQADNAAELQQAFADIAQHMGDLRISK